MAEGALLAIDFRAGNECGFIGFHRRIRRRFFIDSSMQSPTRDFAFKRQRAIGNGNRGMPMMKPDPDRGGQQKDPNDDSE